MTPKFFPPLVKPQFLSRSLWFPPLPFSGAGRVLGVLGNGCVPTACSRPRLPHHPPALRVSDQANRSGRGHCGPVEATQGARLWPHSNVGLVQEEGMEV